MNPIKNAESVLKNYCIKKREDLNLENIMDGERLMLEEEDLGNHLGRICFKKNFGLKKSDININVIINYS